MYIKIKVTNTYIDPCCANQKPSLNPAIFIWFNSSINKIPNPKDTVNQIERSITKYFKFFFQY